ncbi:unnamed protein product, partial [Effrenium voratum]
MEANVDVFWALSSTFAVSSQAGIKPNEIIYGVLISSWAKTSPERAEGLLRRMVEDHLVPNVIACTSVVSAWARKGKACQARRAFEDMRQAEVQPNVIAWNAVLDGYAKAADASRASRCLQ